MPTTTPLTDAINALTTYSNTVTGASDQTLSDAVATLAAGYGGGGSEEIDLSNTALWEVGAVTGTLSRTYSQNKDTNTARLRGVYLFWTGCQSYKFSMDWQNGEWTAQYAMYNTNGLSSVTFTVITSDTILPTTYPLIAIVLRHADGVTEMSASDVSIMKPKLVKQ